jgi:hypothetical protein
MLSLILSLFIVNAGSDVGTTGFNFLKITPSAKQAAMAGASIGLESDNSLSGIDFIYNPAATAQKSIITAGYLAYVADIGIGVVGYSRPSPFSFLKSGGISISYLNSGTIKRTDIAGNELGTFSVSYLNLNAAGNINLANDLNAGLGLKILYGSIDSFSGLGFASDFGFRYHPTIKGLTLGLIIKNLGYQIKSFNTERDKLPLDIGIGAGYNISENINFALDIHKPIDNSILFNLGVEGWVNRYVALRGGYNSLGKDYKTGGGSDIFNGLSVGLGIKVSKYQVDYSFTPMGDLGRLHHITLLFSL